MTHVKDTFLEFLPFFKKKILNFVFSPTNFYICSHTFYLSGIYCTDLRYGVLNQAFREKNKKSFWRTHRIGTVDIFLVWIFYSIGTYYGVELWQVGKKSSSLWRKQLPLSLWPVKGALVKGATGHWTISSIVSPKSVTFTNH